jgi:hypothetical protein
LFGWTFAQRAGYAPHPDWPWFLLFVYGPICLFLLVASVCGKPERPVGRCERVLMPLLAAANCVLVAVPALDRVMGWGLFD